jgi:hypothetical protein
MGTAVIDHPGNECGFVRSLGYGGSGRLRQGHGEPFPLVGVTPGRGRLDPARLTVLAVEPMVLQVEGGCPSGTSPASRPGSWRTGT